MGWQDSGIFGVSAATQPGERNGAISQSFARMPLPAASNDQSDDQPDFHHFMLRSALKGNYIAPITNPRAILDAGCGDGRWAREMAVHFPQAHVVGFDSATVNSVGRDTLDQMTLENYHFVSGSLFGRLPFADGAFEYVHMRLLFLSIPVTHWPHVVRELLRVTQPGGWIELVEGDLVSNGGSALATITQWQEEISRRNGVDPHMGARIGELLQILGLSATTTHSVDLPVGPYGGYTGATMATYFLERIQRMQPQVIAMGLATPETFNQAMAALNLEINRRQYIQPYHIAVAQRH